MINNKQTDEIEKLIKDYNAKNGTEISFVRASFDKLITNFKEVINEYDFELNSIIEDFEDFALSSGLLKPNMLRMLTVPTGKTLNSNIANSCYFDPADRGFSHSTHVGLYSNKAVRAIGKITNVITANLKSDGILEVKEATVSSPSPKDVENIKSIINETKNKLGWDISSNHKFFCVDKFEETFFKKESKRGLFGKKYFNLEKELGKAEFDSTKEIASLLRNITWPKKG